MIKERWNYLMKNVNTNLTSEEIRKGWYNCAKWNVLLVGPGMLEYNYCICIKPNKEK